MLRTDKWWIREIERINRAHAQERAELISTIAKLSGRPLEPNDAPSLPEPEPRTWTPSPEQLPSV